jgi:hypothetical protein
VRGRVLDANGTGIAGAAVFATPAGSAGAGGGALPTTTDVNGTFLVTAPSDGPIDLTAIATGFPPARATSIQPQEGVDVVLRAPRPGHILVKVLDSNGAVAGARVTCQAVPYYPGAGMGDRTPATGADGATTVSSLAPGAYELTASLGTRRGTAAATLAEGGEAIVSVTLP